MPGSRPLCAQHPPPSRRPHSISWASGPCCGSHRPDRSPGGFPTPVCQSLPRKSYSKVPLTWGSATRLGLPSWEAQLSRWLTGAGGRRTHLVGRWSYGGAGGGGGGGRAQGQFRAQPSAAAATPRRGPPPTWSCSCRGFAARRRGAAAGDPAPAGGAGPSAASTTPDHGLRCDSSDLRAAGYRLSPHSSGSGSTVSWAPAVWRLYLESFSQNVASQPSVGAHGLEPSEPRGSQERK